MTFCMKVQLYAPRQWLLGLGDSHSLQLVIGLTNWNITALIRPGFSFSWLEGNNFPLMREAKEAWSEFVGMDEVMSECVLSSRSYQTSNTRDPWEWKRLPCTGQAQNAKPFLRSAYEYLQAIGQSMTKLATAASHPQDVSSLRLLTCRHHLHRLFNPISLNGERMQPFNGSSVLV